MALRIVLISTVQPIVEPMVEFLRELGHEPLAIVSARRPADRPLPAGEPELTDATAPQDVDVLFARDKFALEPLIRGYEADVALCWGFPWKIPLAALQLPRYGSANCHPAKLPRHRGPIPFAWALREGDTELGVTWHRMDAELDTGPILAQTSIPILDEETTIFETGPRMLEAMLSLLPRVFERLAAGDPGDPQATEGASWAATLEEDYATIDWSQPSREIHNQVRAWNYAFQTEPVDGPFTELDGERVKVKRTSLTDPGDGSPAHETGDGQIWILETEPSSPGH